MAKQSVYLETSIISYLASRPSRDLVTAARQQLTRDWWELRRSEFEVYVSQLVADEAADGDREAATRRLVLLKGIPRLEANQAVIHLAQALVDEAVLPVKAGKDAVHLALAAVHGVDLVLTWNCTHMANAELMGSVSQLVARRGYEPPIICTPNELMGEYYAP